MSVRVIYSPDGYMSGQLMKLDRPGYASGDMEPGPTEELAAAAAGYLAYSGPFYVDEKAETLRHHMSVSLFPNWIGDTKERFVELDGDTLTISMWVDGDQAVFRTETQNGEVVIDNGLCSFRPR